MKKWNLRQTMSDETPARDADAELPPFVVLADQMIGAIRDVFFKSGMSQEQFAGLIGISPSHFNRSFVHLRRRPTIYALDRIARQLNLAWNLESIDRHALIPVPVPVAMTKFLKQRSRVVLQEGCPVTYRRMHGLDHDKIMFTFGSHDYGYEFVLDIAFLHKFFQIAEIALSEMGSDASTSDLGQVEAVGSEVTGV